MGRHNKRDKPSGMDENWDGGDDALKECQAFGLIGFEEISGSKFKVVKMVNVCECKLALDYHQKRHERDDDDAPAFDDGDDASAKKSKSKAKAKAKPKPKPKIADKIKPKQKEKKPAVVKVAAHAPPPPPAREVQHAEVVEQEEHVKNDDEVEDLILDEPVRRRGQHKSVINTKPQPKPQPKPKPKAPVQPVIGNHDDVDVSKWNALADIHPDLIKGIKSLGFTSPTLIQQHMIPLAVTQNRDVVAAAETVRVIA